MEGQERSNRNEDLGVPSMPRKRAIGQVHHSYRLLSPTSRRQYGSLVEFFGAGSGTRLSLVIAEVLGTGLGIVKSPSHGEFDQNLD